MIIVRNRELLIPREEFNIGTNYDSGTETREFRLNKVTQGGIDITNLSFKLDIKYANGNTDTATLDKVYPDAEDTEETTESTEDETKVLILPPAPPMPPAPPEPKKDDYISLILTVTKNMLQVPGAVLVQLRGYTADGTLKWTSYQGAFYVEAAINTPTTYTGDLTELEQLESKIDKVLETEASRVAAETERETAETERQTAETGRETAEDQREQDFKDAIEEFERKQIDLTKYANESKSYAVGSTGSREGEDTDNSKYYKEQAATSETNAKTYMEQTKDILDHSQPSFQVDFTDGQLKYTFVER